MVAVDRKEDLTIRAAARGVHQYQSQRCANYQAAEPNPRPKTIGAH
jgi:hypothetical protein